MPTLRDYQQQDVEFLSKLNTMACFNEQRTGKTPTALTVIKQKNCRRVLIICPSSAIYQWIEEFETWLGRPCVTIKRARFNPETLPDIWTDGLVLSYDSFKTIERKDKTIKGLVEYILDYPPDAVILDEAHRIKNTKSANARAVFKLIKVPVRIALTGTPAPNKPEEIYSILYWLHPDKFKSYWKFIDEYFDRVMIPLRSGQYYPEIRGFKPGKQLELQRFLETFSTQRKRKDVMPWLPKKDYQQVRLPATAEQKKYLKELREFFCAGDVVVQGVLDRLIRERQICLDPTLLGLKGSSPKLDYLIDYVKDYPDRPTIVFSKFTSFLKKIYPILQTYSKKIGLIIGETKIETRNQLKNDFQCGKINLLLLNIDTCKEAITLDRAEVAIFTDKYPPVGTILQAEDRFVATTEDKADKPHTIIELMIKGTYDEQLYKLIAERKSEIEVINDYKKYLMKGE